MYVCVCMSVLNKSKKKNSKTAYKDHNFFFNFIYFCLEIRKSFQKIFFFNFIFFAKKSEKLKKYFFKIFLFCLDIRKS